MSRVGKQPIPVPSSAKVKIDGATVSVEGPRGTLEQQIPEGINVELADGELRVSRGGDSGPERARHGLTRSLLANAMAGVVDGFKKELEIIGVGYRGEVKDRELHLALGYSHPVVYPVPEGIEVEIDKQNKISIVGADRQRVGQVAAEIRSLRSPDPYKGKGIRYAGETPKLKVGKAGVGG